MTSQNNSAFQGSAKIQTKLQESLANTTLNTLLANRIPVAVADKLSRQVVNNINFELLYRVIQQDIQDQRAPKQRVLDRTIVHMFELLFRLINSSNKQQQVNHQEFFNLVPRGECLDLFLQLVKEYCMGDEEIKSYSVRLQPIIEKYRHDGVINWPELYKSEEFKDYLSALLDLILTHFREDKKPIPALENKMPIHFQPYRINSFLTQVCRLKEMGSLTVNKLKEQ